MGERGVRNAEVEGSNPLPSTKKLFGYLRSTGRFWGHMGPDGAGVDVAIEPRCGFLMPLRLHVPVGIRCLSDRRVAHLPLHPAEVCPVLQQPRGVAVPGGVVAAIG